MILFYYPNKINSSQLALKISLLNTKQFFNLNYLKVSSFKINSIKI